jgi:hypothetical protein
LFHWNSAFSEHYINTCNSLPENESTIPLGFLDVTVFNAVGEPIEDALITVYILDRFTGEAPILIGLTDSDGKSPHFRVPTKYNISYIAGQELFFTTFNVRVDAVGYYSAQTNNLRFYPGVTSILTYNLTPIPITVPGIHLEQRVLLPPSKFDVVPRD